MGTDQETMYRGVSNAAWGYFLLHVNLTINFNGAALNILPPFAGYLLLLSAIRKLYGERRELALLRPLGILLAAWNLGDWLTAWGGVSLEGLAPVLGLLVRVAGLYFHVQFLTDMAALAETY